MEYNQAMPTYCYSSENGEVIERVYPMGKAPATIYQGEFRRDFAAEQTSRPGRAGWPITCFASGVNANQAQELRDHLRERGVPTEVTSDGDPVYTSPGHRKKALKARGIHDRNSFC